MIDLLWRVGVEFRDVKVSGITTLAFFETHSGSESFPHGILPFKVVFFHALVVIAFSAFTDAGCTQLGECSIQGSANEVVMLISLVTEGEHDVFEAVQLAGTASELEGIVLHVLHELNSVIGWFTLAIGCHYEDSCAVGRELIEIIKVALFRVADEGSKAKFGFCFLRYTDGVFLGGAGLRAVEDDEALFLLWVNKNVIIEESRESQLTVSFILAIKSRGLPEPFSAAAAFLLDAMGACLGFEALNSWSRNRYATARPAPIERMAISEEEVEDMVNLRAKGNAEDNVV